MSTRTLFDAARETLKRLSSSSTPGTQEDPDAFAPLLALVPNLVPIVTRSVRRYPLQVALAAVGLLLIVASRRRRQRDGYSPGVAGALSQLRREGDGSR